MGVGESSPCWGVAGEAGAAPREATSECLRRHPAGVTPRALRAPTEGRVFTAEFLGYFICIHVIYNPNSETENINYVVDKFTQDVGPRAQHQLVLKKWKRHGAACGQVLLTGVSLPASQGDPPNGETAQAGQTLLLPLLWDPSD